MKNLCVFALVFAFLFAGCENSTDVVNNKMDWTAPTHPFMAPNGKSNVHNDAYMTDAYSIKGPDSEMLNITMSNLNQLCVTITFNRENKLVTLGIGADSKRNLYILEPTTLEVIDTYELPIGTDLTPSGAGYFYLDQNYRVVVPTVDKRIFKLSCEGNPAKFILENEYDLSSLPDPCHIISALPDWSGNLWFATEEGIVGIVSSNKLDTVQLSHFDSDIEVKESIANSFAVDETGGVYIVTDYALYRLDTDNNGKPVISWREEYDRGSVKKPSQFSQGSGTTPTLISKDYVAITDNAEPQMNVLVYKRGKQISSNRFLCKVPVFASGASATENSLIAFNNSIIVENNYGYTDVIDFIGKLSEPGLTRIDFNKDGSYNIAWTSNLIIPSLVSKYSSANDLVYTYTKDMEGWYFTAVKASNGELAFRKKAGPDEYFYNNHYSGVVIAPDGAAYVGCPKGVIRFSK